MPGKVLECLPLASRQIFGELLASCAKDPAEPGNYGKGKPGAQTT